ncbi:hypothetical protein KFK09_004254 [Dendrobium nobile]|uniref:Uncharacterized protein n=1 Tax=Dendrobium nobile TaxID=94219 RepID=A0A8T3C2D5_DENNO|nr:hypothetical protein KFK09_004254 [Dendrobium nobile]
MSGEEGEDDLPMVRTLIQPSNPSKSPINFRENENDVFDIELLSRLEDVEVANTHSDEAYRSIEACTPQKSPITQCSKLPKPASYPISRPQAMSKVAASARVEG